VGDTRDYFYAVDATNGEERWRDDLGDGDERVTWSSPTVVDGTVYIGTSAKEERGNAHVYAFDAVTGEREWTFETNRSVLSSPTIVDDTVFVGTHGRQLYALDATTGDEQWRYSNSHRISSSPVVTNGTVIFGVWHSFDDNLRAVDAATGDELWRFDTGDSVQTSPTAVEDSVYVMNSDGVVHALEATTGDPEWDFDAGSGNSSPTAVGETVYAGAGDHLYALDGETGRERWAFDTGDWIAAGPTVAQGTVFTTNSDGSLYAIDVDTGDEVWSVSLGSESRSAPTVVDDTLFVGSRSDRLHAIDTASGDELWAFDTASWVDSSPTVVDDPENGHSIGSRVLLGTLGHHHEQRTTLRSPLSVSGLADASLVGGIESSFVLDVANTTSDPLSDITLTVDAADEPATLSVTDVPETLEPEESATTTLTIEAASEREQPVTVEITADADEVDPVTETVTFEIQEPAEVRIVSAGSADRAFAENPAKFTFEVLTNDVAPVEDVELIPRFDQLPGEWTVHEPELNPDAYRHSAGRWIVNGPPDGDEDEDLNVWSATELAPGMIEQPSIELTVPGALSPDEYALPVEVYASLDGGEVELVDTTEHRFEADKQYTFLTVDAPDEPVVDPDRTTIDVTVSVLSEAVESPEFAFEAFPGEFEVVDGEASDDGFLSISGGSVEWSGTFSEGDTLEAEFVVDLPSGEGAGGTYAIGGEVTASVPELGGERRSRSTRDVLTISDLVGQLTEKDALAADIDGFARFIDDHQRVQPQLEAIETAVDDGSLAPEAASAGLERLYQGERVVERSLELTAGKQPRQVGDRSYELIRPFAEDIADLVIHVAMLPAAMAFRAGRLATVGGARVLRESGFQGLKTIRRTADEMVRIRRARALRQQRQVDDPLEPLNEFFKEVAQEWVEGRIGIDEIRARLSEPLVSRIETHMRESYQLSADAQLEELHDALSIDDLTGGPPGSAQGASGAFWTGTQGMQWRARRGHQLTNEFNEGLISTLGDMRETLAEAEASLDSGFRTFVKLSQEILDLFLTFLTGGLASAMIGRNALVTIDDARETGIEGIVAGEDIGDSV